MRNIKKFTTESEYNAFKSVMVMPNIIYVTETQEEKIKYNPFISVTGVTLNTNTLSFVGTGSTQNLTATVSPNNASIKKVSYASSDDSIATVTSGGVVTAVNYGDAIITVTTEDKGLTAQCNVNIAKNQGQVTTAPTAVTGLTYDSTAQALVTAGVGTGTMMYKLDDGEWDTVIPSASNAGNYVITYKASASTDYTESTTGSVSVSIAKVVPTVTAPTAISDITYNGNEQALVNAGSTNWGTLKYSLDDSIYSTDIPSGTNATNYIVYYYVEGDDNITTVLAQSISNSIGKVTPTVVAPTAKVLTYNGSSQQLANAGSTNFGQIKYNIDGGNWQVSVPSKTNGGSYVVGYMVEGNDNVNTVAAQYINCSINEKPVTATVTLSQTAYTYDGSAKEPTVTVYDGGTVIDPSEYTVTYSNNTNAGTGTVTISDNTGGDYEVIGSATFTINKADRTLSWTSYSSSMMNGSTITVSATPSVGVGDGNIVYLSSDNNVAAVNGNTISGTGDGSCTITATITGGTNYSNASTSYTLTVLHNYELDYLTFTAVDSGTFSFTLNSLNYSLDGGSTWATLAAGTSSPTVSAGSKILWKGTVSASSAGIGRFSSTGKFNAEGNVMSLYYGDNFVGEKSLSGKDYAFLSLFKSNANIINAEHMSLPATTLSFGCYGSMFQSCTALTTAPESLPATVTSDLCYYGMFAGCSQLTKAPKSLPATVMTDRCYYLMFYLCTSLVNCPSVLPAKTLANQCYEGMFNSCASLAQLPTLSATTLATSCCKDMFRGTAITSVPTNYLPSSTVTTSAYTYMFYSCTGLTNAPVLSSTTLADSCYDGMFADCKSLTVAPSLPATTLYTKCYTNMFSGCTSLTTVPSKIGNSSTSVPASACTNMFYECSSLTSVPSDMLPATTVGEHCYEAMFCKCSGLTAAPDLPAPTLTYQCYNGMFSSCSNLNKITCLATNISATQCTNVWLNGVASSGNFYGKTAAGWATGTSGIPDGWTQHLS